MNLDACLHTLSKEPAAPLDVAELALYLARDEYPELDVDAHLGELNAMAHELRPYLRGDLAARVQGLCRYLFLEMGFRGNPREYYDPRNSYLNQVLERRTGIPISLSTVVMAVGRRAGMDIYGIGLPGHFIIKIVHGKDHVFLDPFHGGRQLNVTECEFLVRQVTGQDFELEPSHFTPLPLAMMALRMLNNLKAVYLKSGDFPRAVRVMRRLLQLQPNDPVQHRDLGVSLLRSSQPGQALDHLRVYLEAIPDAEDRETVENIVKQTKKMLAGLN